jgi:hypothetical protein
MVLNQSAPAALIKQNSDVVCLLEFTDAVADVLENGARPLRLQRIEV